jgi:hypothetical protein
VEQRAVKWVVRPGYAPEEYAAVRALCKDGAGLPETFAEWARYAEYFERRMRKLGRNIVRVPIVAETFSAWCKANEREPDAAARQAYADAHAPAAARAAR